MKTEEARASPGKTESDLYDSLQACLTWADLFAMGCRLDQLNPKEQEQLQRDVSTGQQVLARVRGGNPG